MSDSTTQSQSSLVACTCPQLGTSAPADFHGPRWWCCKCPCRKCRSFTAAFTNRLRAAQQQAQLRRELEERDRRWAAERGTTAEELLRQRYSDPGYFANRDRAQQAAWKAYQRAFELQQAKYDIMIIFRPALNRSDFRSPGLIGEHVSAVLKAVQLHAERCGLTVEEGVLHEGDRRIASVPALKELLTRMEAQVGAEPVDDGDPPGEPLLWQFTWEGELTGATVEDLHGEALTQLIAARRWTTGPARAARLALPPGMPLADRIEMLADRGAWTGALSDLAARPEIAWNGKLETLAAELAIIWPALSARGVVVAKTGGRTGPTRRAEWMVRRLQEPPLTPLTPPELP
jgi:hypothetical protein